MGFQIVTEHGADFLRVRTSGNLASQEDLLAYGRRVASLCDARETRRILLDERRAHATVALHDRFSVVDELASELLRARIQRVACLSRASVKIAQPIENAAPLRGLEYRFFPNADEAEAWLREDLA